MYLFVIQYDATDNTPLGYKLWECEGKPSCGDCPGKFFCVTNRMVWVGNCLGIVVRQDERGVFGVGLEINNSIFTYKEYASQQCLSEEDCENLE